MLQHNLLRVLANTCKFALACFVLSSHVLARQRSRKAEDRAHPHAARISLARPSEPRTGLRLYLAGAFHNNEHTLTEFESACISLASLERVHRLHVTVYESGSTDATQAMLIDIEERLRAVGVSTAFTIGGDIERGGRQRIDFLADVRNQLLKPLRDMSRSTKFDNVVFVNDVFFTAEDVIRLVDVGGDIVCGVDYQKAPDDPASALKFYDAWVARTLYGMPFRNDFPFVLHNPRNAEAWRSAMDRNMTFSDIIAKMNALKLPEKEPFQAVQGVQCCWNGVLAVKARPLTEGLTFRSNFPNECLAASESHFCTDMWSMGYKKVAVHYGVRVTYDKYPGSVIRSLVPTPADIERSGGGGSQTDGVEASIFAKEPVRESVCCGMKTLSQINEVFDRTYKRESFETDDLFALRIWSAIAGYDLSPHKRLFTRMKVAVRGKQDFRPSTKYWIVEANINHVQHSPTLPCFLETPRNMTSKITLADPSRKIPRRIMQLGSETDFDAYSSLIWTWRHLHPDHEYRFFTFEDVIQIAADKYKHLHEIMKRQVDAHRMDEFRLLSILILVYEFGGVYVDVRSVATDSLSKVIGEQDDIVYMSSDQIPSELQDVFALLAATPRNTKIVGFVKTLLQHDWAVWGRLSGRIAPDLCGKARCLPATQEKACGGRYLTAGDMLARPAKGSFSVLTSTAWQSAGSGPSMQRTIEWAECVLKSRGV
jgi:hypothetical protein